MMSDWYKDGFYWRHPDSGDAGDLIFNTLSRIIDMDDDSDWAWEAFCECGMLLEQGKRWPDRFNDIPTRRSQTKMTRDPYTVYYTLAVKWGCIDLIEGIRMPWYCYSPIVWRWKKRLIKERKKPWWRWRLSHYRYLALVFKTSDDPNIISNQSEL